MLRDQAEFEDIKVGAVVSRDSITSRTRGLKEKDDLFNPFYQGDHEGSMPLVGSGPATFAFNKLHKGWHYGWVSGKHTSNKEHVLRAFLFVPISGTQLKCIATYDSKPFTIFCRRRDRNSLPDLPPQFASEEHKRLRIVGIKGVAAEAAGAAAASKAVAPKQQRRNQVPHSAPPPSSATAAATATRGTDAQSRKRKAPTVKAAAPKSRAKRKGGANDDMLSPLASEEDMFAWDPELLAMQNPLAEVKLLPDASEDAKLWRVMAALTQVRAPRGAPSETPAAQPAASSKSSQTLPVAPAQASTSADFDEFAQAIADFLDNAIPSPDRDDVSLDFQDEPVDLGALDRSMTRERVMEDLARFLIDEKSFTDAIASAFSHEEPANGGGEVSDDELDARKRKLFEVLRAHLDGFLKQHELSLDDLDKLLRSTGAESYTYVSGEQKRNIHKHVSSYGSSKATSSSSSSSSTSASAPASASVSAALGIQPTVMIAGSGEITAEAVAKANEVAEQLLKDAPADLLNLALHAAEAEEAGTNLNGTWERTPSTLADLERMREMAGIPYVMRKLLAAMEKEITIRQFPNRMEVYNGRKLVSDGYSCYMLDGKEHEGGGVVSPLLGGRETVLRSYQAWFVNSQLTLIQNYTDRHRLVRRTWRTKKKLSSDSDEEKELLESVMSLQHRASPSAEWENQIVLSASAVRCDTDAAKAKSNAKLAKV